MGYRVDISINGVAKLPNRMKGAHWAVVIRERDRIRKLVWAFFAGHKPKAPLKRARIHITRCSPPPEPDYDNLVFSHKYVTDALVGEGIIWDDSPKHILEQTHDWEPASRIRTRTRIQVEEA